MGREECNDLMFSFSIFQSACCCSIGVMVCIVELEQLHQGEMCKMMQLQYFKFSLCCVFKTSPGVAGGFDWKRITDKQAFALRAFSDVTLFE